MEVNTIGIMHAVREFCPAMLRKNKGHVVTISSMSGYVSPPGLSEYSGSKAAATAIDESLRLEFKKLGKNVKTTCICPYFINTGMFEGAKSTFPF
jgi:all-trans-retinol dehydrogenase (NAD+)